MLGCKLCIRNLYSNTQQEKEVLGRGSVRRKGAEFNSSIVETPFIELSSSSDIVNSGKEDRSKHGALYYVGLDCWLVKGDCFENRTKVNVVQEK